MSDQATISGFENGDNRQPNGQFAPGNPGGPGRPKGRSALQKALDAMANDDAEAVYGKVKEMALGGDLAACKEILSRAWPVPRGRAVEVELPKLESLADLPAMMAQILRAVAAGELLSGEAQELGAVLEGYRKSVELVDIEWRLIALERKSK